MKSIKISQKTKKKKKKRKRNKQKKNKIFFSVTAKYISNCFGVDLGAFIPTSNPPPTRPAVKF